MKQRYTAALVGLGRIAWRFDAGRVNGPALTHFGIFQRSSSVTTVCGFSPGAQERLDFEQACHVETCELLEQLLKKRPDIISICSPLEFHYEQTLACLEHEVPMIWLEKPPTSTLAELDTLLNHPATRTGKTRVLVNYMRRYAKTYDRLRTIWGKQTLGRPLAIQVLYSRGLELNGSHFLDLVFSMLADQPPLEVTIATAERGKSSPTFTLRFADDFVVTFCGHDTGYHINDVLLTCDNGRISVRSGGVSIEIEQTVENERYPGFFRLQQSESSLVESDDSFSVALADLITAHETRRDPYSSLTTARLTQTVIEEVRRK
jgi:predicted dehydrogenase